MCSSLWQEAGTVIWHRIGNHRECRSRRRLISPKWGREDAIIKGGKRHCRDQNRCLPQQRRQAYKKTVLEWCMPWDRWAQCAMEPRGGSSLARKTSWRQWCSGWVLDEEQEVLRGEKERMWTVFQLERKATSVRMQRRKATLWAE